MPRTLPAPPSPPAQPQSLLLTAREAAALCSVGVSTLYRLAAARKVPRPVRIGGAVRWRRAELLAWLDAGCPACED